MNKQTKQLTAVLAVGSLLLLAGCAKYKALPLHQPTLITDKKALSLEHKVFTKQDCQTFLGRKNLLKKGYQPVQLTITNTTDRSYTYSASSLSLPTVPAQVVATKVETSTLGRFFGYNIAATACYAPAICAGALFTICPPALAIIAIPSALGGLALTTASFVDPIKSHKANKQLSADFATKTLARDGIIRPGETVNGIVFVPKKSFKDYFTFTVNDLQSNKAVVLSSEIKTLIK